ncbi:C-type lectin domain family 2 member B-like [Anolis sagrei]|uniref:C-type lectin domain family 2 member B-like n=1 Tax=Anolis sagrei TaxID=38937 RepID=UPI00352241C6
MNGEVKVPLSRRSSEYLKNGSAWKNACFCKSEKGKWERQERHLCFGIVMLNFLLLVLITTVVLLGGGIFEKCTVPHPSVLADPCPNGWIGYQRKCYYFSEMEGNWTSSSTHCSSYNASLALIDSQEEMNFLFRYKTSSDHWIGLQRDPGQPWRWVNGSIYKGWLRTNGGRRCAYLTHGVIASSSCTREEHWICSKEMAKVIAQIVDVDP